MVGAISESLICFSGVDISINTAQVVDNKKVSDHHGIIPTLAITKTDLPIGYNKVDKKQDSMVK